MSCLEGVKYLFEITEKDTRQIWESNKCYFNSLSTDIKEIYSYGFSFSQVDMIYILAICHSLDTSRITWYLSDFSSSEEIEIYKSRIKISGFQGDFATFHINNNETNKKSIKKIWYKWRKGKTNQNQK